MQHQLTSIALVAMLGPLLVGCGEKKTKDYGVPENRGTQKAGLKELAKRGTEELVKLTKVPNPKVRMDAASALGYKKNDPAATKALLDMIETGEENDRIVALMALGLQGPDEAKAILQKYIKDENAKLRTACCIGIAEYGDSTLYPLIDEVAANDPDADARRIAAAVRLQIENGRYVPFDRKGEKGK
ncbi:HEAT repeat domain-containing protein [bacterium]|nr:HEAT repeat domain-containing protein [bacterium]